MEDIKIKKINIIRFRSIINLAVDIDDNNIVTFCGANNVGKTNFLRALDLFFSKGYEKFNDEVDIPYHIAEGSRGQGYSTKIEVKFKLKEEIITISKSYTCREKKKSVDIKGIGAKKRVLNDIEINNILDKFQYIFLQSSNTDIPELISKIINSEVLGLGLRKKKGQNQILDKLNEFTTGAEQLLKSIETEITNMIRKTTLDIEGIDTKNWKAKMNFPTFERLTDAITGMVNFTLIDTNDYELDSKGSGIQKLILFSLIKYISEKKQKNIIWGLDEPESFLQPSLQKQLMKEMKKIASSGDYVMITTHSNLFIDLNNLNCTKLLVSNNEIVEYKRKPGVKFYKVETLISPKEGLEKIEAIKKHLGIEKNDSWNIMPKNILVEGNDDKKYIKELANALDIFIPNIISADSASKEKAMLSYLKMNIDENSNLKIKVKCVFDNDSAGQNAKKDIDESISKYKPLDVSTVFIPYVTATEKQNNEIEDFIYPELMRKGLNQLLNYKKYTGVSKKDFDKRLEMAYQNKPILEFINAIVAQINPDKSPINFQDLSIKLFLCDKICEQIKIIDIDTYDKEFPNVRIFLEELSK